MHSASIARKVVVVFAIFGVTWIAVSDIVLYEIVDDPVLTGRLETVKGWAFVLFTAGVIYVVTDRGVRDLARANAKTTTVVNSISDGVLILDPRGTIVEANPAAVSILGVDTASELVGLDADAFSRRFHVTRPDGRQVSPRDYVSKRAARGELTPPYKVVVHTNDRTPVVLLATGAPVRSTVDGSIIGAVTVLHDVTAFDDIDRMRDSFVSSAAHTLKTPIAVIRAQLDILAEGSSASGILAAEIIARQCGKISRVTDNLVVLARLRSNSLHLDPEAVDISVVMDEAAAAMKQAAPDHKLMTAASARPLVFADKTQLGLVVRDMIELAYRRARPHTDVAVSVDETDSHGRVTVSYDPVPSATGVEADESAGYAGLGLERYVCEQLVAASNGALGTVFEHGHCRRDWLAIPTIEREAHA